MKKTYIAPALFIQSVAVREELLVGSLPKSGDTVTGGNGGWTKSNGDWSDIWGTPAAGGTGVNP